MQQNDGIQTEVKDHIMATANNLYEQSGRSKIPTVDQVRRTAKVDMNAATEVMREWRRAQATQANPIIVSVPEAVQQLAMSAVASIWNQAQELANESLRNAQAAWEREKTELEELRRELIEAFESQGSELELIRKQLEDTLAANTTLKELCQRNEDRLTDAKNLADGYKTESENAVRSAIEAREKAAKLEGNIETLDAQNKKLLELLDGKKKPTKA